jgi:hypothetical protein
VVDISVAKKAAFAYLSAISFPGIPIWPGIQRRVTFSICCV